MKTIPLEEEEKGFIGAIELFVPENRTFDSEWTSDDLKTIAFTDALCEIPNRRYGEMQLKKLRLEQEEGEAPYALAIVDIDHFGMSNAAESEQAGRKEVTHGGFRVSENADYRYLAPVVLSPFRLRGSTGVG